MQAVISYSTSGDKTLVSGSPGRTIRVLGFMLVTAGSVAVTWKSGSSSLTGAMTPAAGVPLPWVPADSLDTIPALTCASGEDLVLNVSANAQVSGWVLYDVL